MSLPTSKYSLVKNDVLSVQAFGIEKDKLPVSGPMFFHQWFRALAGGDAGGQWGALGAGLSPFAHAHVGPQPVDVETGGGLAATDTRCRSPGVVAALSAGCGSGSGPWRLDLATGPAGPAGDAPSLIWYEPVMVIQQRSVSGVTTRRESAPWYS